MKANVQNHEKRGEKTRLGGEALENTGLVTRVGWLLRTP